MAVKNKHWGQSYRQNRDDWLVSIAFVPCSSGYNVVDKTEIASSSKNSNWIFFFHLRIKLRRHLRKNYVLSKIYNLNLVLQIKIQFLNNNKTINAFKNANNIFCVLRIILIYSKFCFRWKKHCVFSFCQLNISFKASFFL